jgi:hypothetical protein
MNCGSRRDRWWQRCSGPRRITAPSRRRRRIAAAFETLEIRLLLTGTPLISEFLAANSDGLQDADGESSDWIEIYNPAAAAIDLEGWSLTDDPGDLNQWVFPDVSIGANEFLTVFASGKDRTSGPELHTNFRLSAGGDYLALVDPSQVVISEYTPSYPVQVTNVSYGVGFDTAKLIDVGASAKALVPSNDSLGNSWTTAGFNPAGWTTGTTGVGFGIVQPGFNVLYAKANVLVSDLGVARDVLDDPGLRTLSVYDTAPVVNYLGNGGGGRYGGDLAFPTQTIGEDINDFVVQATGSVTIPAAGNWTFGVNSDDGFGLQLERNGVVFTSEFPNPRGPSDTLATFAIPTAGEWNVSLVMYERGGGASVELFAASGAYQTFNANVFRLVGNDAGGGLAVHSTIGAGSAVVVGMDIGSSMRNVNATAFIRVPFTVANPAAYDALQLKMRYDAGFVAYLNGVEVARRNAPASLAYNSAATADRAILDATTPETINLTPYLNLLNAGNNVLAIRGLNSSASDDSFLILPELTASAVHPEQQRYFKTPTPGDPNLDPALGVISRVSASVPAGFHNAPINVPLTTQSAGAYIRYTVDGSAPTATHGTLYSAPITIGVTTTLRAGAFRTDYIAQPTITRTYLFLDDVIQQSPSDDISGGHPDVGAPPAGWPATWGNNVVDYGMDQSIVNQAGAAQVKAALLAIPSLSITTDLANLFDPVTGIYSNARNDGRDWERDASVELLNPDGSGGFQINAGLRVRGGYSRSPDNPKHAFRLFFRSEYGESSLEYPLFGAAGVSSFKKLDLRTAQNYSWSFGGDPSNTMIQDGFARQSQGDMGQPYTRSIWVNLYLDGQYWGVYQIEERPEAEFAASYFGGAASNYDVIKPEAGPYTIYATDGNLDAYQRLWQFVTTQDLTSNANYFHLQGKDANGVNDPTIPNEDVLLDVDNLITYMIGILHGGNLDAPISNFLGNQGVNNFFAVRDRTGRSGFKYVQHDAEHTLHNVNENRNGPYPAGQTFERFNPQFLHQQLMANPEYLLKFADTMQKFFFGDGPMTAASAAQRFQNDANQLDVAIIAESARWGDAKRPTSPLGRAHWLTAVASMQNFLANRNPILLQQFRNNGLFPNLGAPGFLINGVPQNSGEVLPGSLLRMAADSGLIYYTTDGTDPRLVGGGINPAAQVYDPSATATTLLVSGSSWKYYDQGANLGTAWRGSAYNDGAWSSGNAELGYGDGDEATVVGFGPNASNKYITTYFRKTFNVADTTGLSGLKLHLRRDDGAVVYINGVEAARSNMPTGAISAATLAVGNVGGTDEQTFYQFDIDPNLLHAGANVIAVELHQSSAGSSDISFDATLVASIQSNPGLTIDSSLHLVARVMDGSTWSPVSEATFAVAVAANADNLAITEVHYNPAAFPGASSPPLNDAQNFEFIELRNIGVQTIRLTGVEFTEGITFDFSTGGVPYLAPGQSVVVVSNLIAFEARYGTEVLVAGVYSSTNLSNGGERLLLVDATGATIQEFSYDDDLTTTPAWPASADGGGYSLTVRSVVGNYDLPSNWRASHLLHGTPGYDENDYPSSLSLSNLSVDENSPQALVGVLSASDPNVGDTLTFSLVDDAGGRFTVDGPNLVVTNGVQLDYETSASFAIIVRVVDAGGLALERNFTISVNNVNETPLEVNLSQSSIDENQPSGTIIGSFSTTDPDAPPTTQTFTYSLLAGDVAAFTIDSAGNLKTNAVFNFEARDSYSIMVRSTDQGNLTVDQAFTISVNNINEAPQIALVPILSSLAENVDTSAALDVADIVITDDALGSRTLWLSGIDSAKFKIVGSKLRLKAGAALDHETHPSLDVTININDSAVGGSLDDSDTMSISVSEAGDSPTWIVLSGNVLAENQPVGAILGTLTTNDPDQDDTFTYALVGGTGDADNAAFTVGATTGILQTAASFDFESKGSYAVRVRTTDAGGLWFERAFTISVTNINDAPQIALANELLELAEDADTSSVRVVGEIVISDDALGSKIYYILGGLADDARLFEIDGATGQLLLRAGAVLNHETNPELHVTIVIDDPSIGSSWDNSVMLALAVTDANDSPTIEAEGFPGLSVTYFEQDSPVALVKEGIVEDEDGAVRPGATLRAAILTNATASDRLLLSSSSVSVAANGNVSYNGKVIGTLSSAGLAGNPLEVAFNSLATLWSIRKVLQSVRFETLGENPAETTRQVLLRVTDGAGGISEEVLVDVQVFRANDAPVLNTSLSPVLRTIWEDARSPRGTPLSELVQGAITDVDAGALQGIAIVGAFSNSGAWQYRLTGSTLWQMMGEISEESALLLSVDAGTQVRFVPKRNFNGQVWLSYRAWDRTEGDVGQKLSLIGMYGDSHAFSARKEDASLQVTAVNDRPRVLFAGNIGYQRDKPAIVLAPYARLYDIDSSDFDGGQLRVHITESASGSNRLGIAGGFTVDANYNVLRAGIIVGTLNANGGIGTQELTVSFNANATKSVVKELLRSITFKTVRGAMGMRKAVVTLSDGDGGTSTVMTKTINVI